MDDKLLSLPLNQAHTFARAAESCESCAKFDEARKCHQKTISLLEESAKIASFDSTRESIRLQIESHQRQLNIISLKILRYTIILKKNQEHLAMMTEQQSTWNSTKSKDETLQWAIYKNIEEADSLIDTLALRDSFKPDEKSKDEVSSATVYNNGVKHPKSESTVIEELHTINSKLRELISQLLSQLEESQIEADSLRAKVRYYESLQGKKPEAKGPGEQNLIDFNSMSSSGESIGIMP